MSSSKDRDVIRHLAGQMAEIAQHPSQQEKIESWKALNSLRPQRPMVWITEIPWGEFEHKVEDLRPQCEEKQFRNIETNLRRKLFIARHLPCDEVLHPEFEVQRCITGWGYGVETDEEQLAHGDSNIQSHHYKPVISEFEDIEKICMPDVRHDEEATEQRVNFFHDLFGDILPVRAAGIRQHFFPAWDVLVRWTGVTEALMDLIQRPDFIHGIMRRMTDASLERMRQYENLNLLDYPHPMARVGSGGAGYTDELPQPDADPSHYRCIDQWGGATPQIFSDVSPEMHREFALDYEIEIMQHCGLNYYGCCEPVHNKMHILADVPRLRKISISPWCDTAQAAANAHQTYVFSHKPTPAILAEDRFDADRAEQDLRERLEKSGNMPCEFIMKDISTVQGDVQRVIDWCTMASRVVKETAATV